MTLESWRIQLASALVSMSVKLGHEYFEASLRDIEAEAGIPPSITARLMRRYRNSVRDTMERLNGHLAFRLTYNPRMDREISVRRTPYTEEGGE